LEPYFKIIKESYSSYFHYLLSEIGTISWDNYFYGLIVISLIVWILEIRFPWRKNQNIIRKGFWLDTFYLFFNFFLLNLIMLIALTNTAERLFTDFLAIFGLSIEDIQIISISKYPFSIGLIVFFIVTDFMQWVTHRLLHRIPFLWQFHKVHHTIKEMGFAAHFRYHWMEPIIYKSILYIPVAIIGGFTVEKVFIVHFIAIAIGHLNHANINLDYGIFKYIFNNPKMHIWHHSKKKPGKYGVNFGISLSIWDYIFKTQYIPSNGRDNELDNDDRFPQNFINQSLIPISLFVRR